MPHRIHRDALTTASDNLIDYTIAEGSGIKAIDPLRATSLRLDMFRHQMLEAEASKKNNFALGLPTPYKTMWTSPIRRSFANFEELLMIRYLMLTFAAAAGAILLLSFTQSFYHSNTHGVVASESDQWALYGLALLFLWLGTFAGSAYKKLARIKDQGQDEIESHWIFFKSVLKSIDFIIGVLGSPIILGLIFQHVEFTSLFGVALVAFQDGFASTSIIAAFAQQKEQQIKNDQE